MGPVVEPLYVRYQVPDLALAESFLLDFGLLPVRRGSSGVHFGGRGSAPFLYEAVAGPEPRFLGAGFRIDDRRALDRLASLPGSSPIENAVDAPGGGWRVRM